MSEVLNFNFKKGCFIIINEYFECKIFKILPFLTEGNISLEINSILRIDDFTISGSTIYITMSLLKKYNKHINNKSYFGKLKVCIFNLNGLKYFFIDEKDIENKILTIDRKKKINILNDYN